jgi:hypothetical protein
MRVAAAASFHPGPGSGGSGLQPRSFPGQPGRGASREKEQPVRKMPKNIGVKRRLLLKRRLINEIVVDIAHPDW